MLVAAQAGSPASWANDTAPKLHCLSAETTQQGVFTVSTMNRISSVLTIEGVGGGGFGDHVTALGALHGLNSNQIVLVTNTEIGETLGQID
jgi:hypothetical protein